MDDVKAILYAVHAAYFICINRRDGHLENGDTELMELNNHLRIEIEIIGIELERDLGEDAATVYTISRVVFAHAGTDHKILVHSEDLIADEFIERHTATEGGEGFEHP